MKRLLLIFILTFSFQSWTKADDIRDFEIEGMSIGDSALDFVSKEFIEKEKYYYKKNTDKFIIFNIDESNNKSFEFKKYDGVYINYKNKDSKYIIHSLRAKNFYKNNIEECYKLKKEIIVDFKNQFKIINRDDQKGDHWADDSGKSKVDSTFLEIIGGRIVVQCFDWSEEMNKWDGLNISISTSEYADWLDDLSSS